MWSFASTIVLHLVWHDALAKGIPQKLLGLNGPELWLGVNIMSVGY